TRFARAWRSPSARCSGSPPSARRASRGRGAPSLMARILVIDDDVQVRGAVRRILERAGHTVEDVGNGDAGLRAHRERPAELIITDIFMPERDGIETVRQLRRESPQVKIIVISGGDRTQTMDLRKDAELLGAARSLRKPFELSELVQAVGELLGESRPRT